MVTVYRIEELPDGTCRCGDTIDIECSAAVALIRLGTVKAVGYSRFVVPEDWEEKEQVLEEEIEADEPPKVLKRKRK